MTFEEPSNDPQHAVVMGIPVVTIPLADYAKLLDYQVRFAERTISHDQLERPRRSLIARNPEVAVFLAQNLDLEPVATVLNRFRRKFGKAQTPSRTAAYRYWQKLRKEALKAAK